MKISYTGTHGTGKSTSVYKLANELKIRHPGKTVGVFMDNARNSPFGFNKNTPKEAQLWIFTSQLLNELTLGNKYDIIITDRSIFDSIAYVKFFGFVDLADKMLKLGMEYMNSYDTIIFKTMVNNNYLVKEGEDRDVQDLTYRSGVEIILGDIYKYLLDNGAKFRFTKI